VAEAFCCEAADAEVAATGAAGRDVPRKNAAARVRRGIWERFRLNEISDANGSKEHHLLVVIRVFLRIILAECS
jgi:hypothetical protein